MTTLHVDCAACTARPAACSDCVVSVLLGVPAAAVELTSEEQSAIQALSAAGLVPPLRLARPTSVCDGELRWAT